MKEVTEKLTFIERIEGWLLVFARSNGEQVILDESEIIKIEEDEDG